MGHRWTMAAGLTVLVIGAFFMRAAGQGPTPYEEARLKMVETQIAARGVKDVRVLEALRAVPRHAFVPDLIARAAYDDRALPIGNGQTISQPYIVALMSELLEVEPGDKVLEVGTGSGYQAAVLDAMGTRVWSIEIVEPLARSAAARLKRLGYERVTVRHGDGYQGWPEHAPFDGIIVTAAPPRIPEPLLEQLRVGGRMVVPVGEEDQSLTVITRIDAGTWEKQVILPVLFVPMTGEVQTPRPKARPLVPEPRSTE